MSLVEVVGAYAAGGHGLITGPRGVELAALMRLRFVVAGGRHLAVDGLLRSSSGVLCVRGFIDQRKDWSLDWVRFRK